MSAVANDPWIKIAGIDADGVLRGKDIANSKFVRAIQSSTKGLPMCSVLFGWDIEDEVCFSLTAQLSLTLERLPARHKSNCDPPPLDDIVNFSWHPGRQSVHACTNTAITCSYSMMLRFPRRITSSGTQTCWLRLTWILIDVYHGRITCPCSSLLSIIRRLWNPWICVPETSSHHNCARQGVNKA
jgi:hypothetical protein